ncbi:restriction endonuclease subunit S [Enterococcus faecalis]|uniref:restriction endonuclease subunit S n=2 Tax=Enterococcus faecalis TaxID=1351 RepID=UPI002221D893|nr:restriction endonuclease subunit S [Enterococcus faecalis]UYY44118.1 restriction endonuclease subunit S [Enterococcus faecalis]
MKKVPRLRFRGFQEDWELCKVKDFLIESKIKGSNGKIAKKLTVKLWRKGIVAKEEVYEGSLATQYYVRKSGQFMYGKLDFLNQAFGIVPIELDGYESTVDSPSFDFKPLVDSVFFLEYVSLEKFYKYQGNIANGSRKAKRIHVETFFNMPLPTPSYKEQQKIGTLFKQLDDTITLHQRKLEQLKELKKAYLQLMFVPTNTKNNKVPKLRFANFEENWELCKLENIIEKQIKGKAKVENLCNGSVEYLDANRLNGGKPIYTKALPDVSERDIIILWDGSKAGKVYYGFKGVLGSTLKAYQLKECANSQFIYQQLLDNQNNIYNNYRTPNIPHVVKNFSSIFPIWMTSFEEQSQMADILSNLDNRIILQQNLTDTMISLKKSYLQNMFI